MALVYTTTRTRTIPVTHAHLVKNNDTSGLEAFVSSAGVELSISGHTGPESEGVIGSGNYERINHYNFKGIEEATIIQKLGSLSPEYGVPRPASEYKYISSKYGASGNYYRVVFDLGAKQEQVEAVFERLNELYPKAY
ncbi:MAG TPA: hypothetical protein VI564_04075 [Candidatus Nanoarchaeia archaeon]|nr:hypothetical protein [Candidatus Nanoarchaeia archaeon]